MFLSLLMSGNRPEPQRLTFSKRRCESEKTIINYFLTKSNSLVAIVNKLVFLSFDSVQMEAMLKRIIKNGTHSHRDITQSCSACVQWSSIGCNSRDSEGGVGDPHWGF